jgi:hypothetical protein
MGFEPTTSRLGNPRDFRGGNPESCFRFTALRSGPRLAVLRTASRFFAWNRSIESALRYNMVE